MVKGSETERRGGGIRGEGERAKPGEMKSRPEEERKRERDAGRWTAGDEESQTKRDASVKWESERRDGGRAAGTRGLMTYALSRAATDPCGVYIC